LQSAMPEATQGHIEGLTSWASCIVNDCTLDPSYPNLAPYAYWYTLMGRYNARPDLQAAYPNAYTSKAAFLGLVNWAGGVVEQKWVDSDYQELRQFGYWYALMSTYNNRGDLQVAMPNAYATGYVALVNWAGGVVTQKWTDGAYNQLEPFGYYYNLMMTYNQRLDLQAAFPAAYSSWASFTGLVNWAGGVVTQQWVDPSYSALNMTGYWYDLMHLYAGRSDLQTAYPESYTFSTSYTNLLCWAKGVVLQRWSDPAYNQLQKYAQAYIAMASC